MACGLRTLQLTSLPEYLPCARVCFSSIVLKLSRMKKPDGKYQLHAVDRYLSAGLVELLETDGPVP